jgi:hypothetical protein
MLLPPPPDPGLGWGEGGFSRADLRRGGGRRWPSAGVDRHGGVGEEAKVDGPGGVGEEATIAAA